MTSEDTKAVSALLRELADKIDRGGVKVEQVEFETPVQAMTLDGYHRFGGHTGQVVLKVNYFDPSLLKNRNVEP